MSRFGGRQRSTRVLLPALFALAPSLAAQASPYLSIRDPRNVLLEHLIARGEVVDPTPMIRPFFENDVRASLAAVDTSLTGQSSRIARTLQRVLPPPDGEQWWRVGVGGGGQAYSYARRDMFHPAGDGGVQPYAEVDLAAGFGPVVLHTRPAVERRVTHDPDWPGRTKVDVAGRLLDGYLSAQFKFVDLYYGQLERNLGPVGLPGIPLSNYGYERQGLGLRIGNNTIRLSALASDLRDESDSASQVIHRYYFVHRLDIGVSRRVKLGLWETNILAGVDRQFETRYRNPLSLSYLANTIGLGDKGNVMLGFDLHWNFSGKSTFQAQVAIDDITYQDRDAPDRNPDRYAFTLTAFGPLGRSLAWRALYSQASSMAFRAYEGQFQDFTDAGVGIGRNFADDDQTTVGVSIPWRGSWVFAPELTYFRQGEGKLNDPYPIGTARGDTPILFIGTVEKTFRAALGVAAEEGPIRVLANGGVNQVSNADNVDGRSRTRFVGQITVTIGLRRHGAFH
jgi:hypothetical protein